jgi:hypothetical protein
MSILNPNYDSICATCATQFDSWSDLGCPKCLAKCLAEEAKLREIKILGVETDINKRWAAGMDHHPQSRRLYEIISTMDHKYGGDYFEFKSGGDGDNGEHLMYLLDIYFEQQEL